MEKEENKEKREKGSPTNPMLWPNRAWQRIGGVEREKGSRKGEGEEEKPYHA
jgi:hypothetical protein